MKKLIALSLLLTCICLQQAGAAGSSVTLTIDDVRSSKGHVLSSLCADRSQFMRGCATAVSRDAAVQGTMKIVFKNIVPGTYAISVFQDENDNDRYDYPDEGYAIGNDAPYPPNFDAASIEVSGDASARVKMIYFTAAQARQQTSIKPVIVRDSGLNAEFYAPEHEGKLPAVLVIGGSEGGMGFARLIGVPFTEAGYAVMVLAYFGADGLPRVLDRIPLEYFKSAIDWLKARPEVDASRVALYGVSKGAEAVLVIGSHYNGIKAIIASAPSDIVWQALSFPAGPVPHSSWMFGGKELPFVPFDTSKPYSSGEPFIGVYTRSLQAQPDHDDAIIKVENISGAILLLSGTDDQMWNSTDQSDRIMARLKALHFRHLYQHLSYPGAGHLCCVNPGAIADHAAPSGMILGGTPQVDDKSRVDAWAKTLAFLKANL